MLSKCFIAFVEAITGIALEWWNLQFCCCIVGGCTPFFCGVVVLQFIVDQANVQFRNNLKATVFDRLKKRFGFLRCFQSLCEVARSILFFLECIKTLFIIDIANVSVGDSCLFRVLFEVYVT